MRIKDDLFKLYFEYALGILAGLLVFREQATPLILLFILLNIIFSNRLHFQKKRVMSIVIISIPFFINLIFIWNNESLFDGVKHGEKYLACLIFPIIIIFKRFSIEIGRVFRVYSFVFTLILIICFFRHFFTEYDQFAKYLNGELVWQMGYNFALSMDLHAPALNMHVAFLVIINLYLLLSDYVRKKLIKIIIYRIIVFVLSVFILFVINTRLAIFNVFLGIPLISGLFLLRNVPKIKAYKLISIITGTIIGFALIFILTFPYVIDKFTSLTFKHMDKVGQLDSFDNPEAEVYSSLVTRVSIWKTTIDVISTNMIFGVGSADSKKELINKYKETNQKFLYRHKFPVHNQFLDFFLKFGLVGLVGLVIYIFYPLWLYKKFNKPYVLYFFLLFFISNFTDDFMIRYDGIVFSALWFSIFTIEDF